MLWAMRNLDYEPCCDDIILTGGREACLDYLRKIDPDAVEADFSDEYFQQYAWMYL